MCSSDLSGRAPADISNLLRTDRAAVCLEIHADRLAGADGKNRSPQLRSAGGLSWEYVTGFTPQSTKCLNVCTSCGNKTEEPSEIIGLHPYERGNFWADCIGCGGGIIGVYVSERVIDVLVKEKMKFGKAFEASVLKPYTKKLRGTEAPKYFYLKCEIGAKYDFVGSGYTVEKVCPECGCVLRNTDHMAKEDIFIEGTWNGSDIFVTDLSRGRYFCTERILELAAIHQWTNFRFLELTDVGNYGSRGIDYLGKRKTKNDK